MLMIMTIISHFRRGREILEILLTTPMTEGSQPLYKARGPSSLSTVDRAWNIPLYW